MDEEMKKRIVDSVKKDTGKRGSEKAVGSKRNFVEVKSSMDTPTCKEMSAFEKAIKETAELPEDKKTVMGMECTPDTLNFDEGSIEVLTPPSDKAAEEKLEAFKAAIHGPFVAEKLIHQELDNPMDYEKVNASILEILIRERKAKNISQTEMASILGMSQTNYYNIERGKTKMGGASIRAACRVLGLQIVIKKKE